jgi:hypothetical protein
MSERIPGAKTCGGCPHKPHYGMCTGRNGQTAAPCPCSRQHVPPARMCEAQDPEGGVIRSSEHIWNRVPTFCGACGEPSSDTWKWLNEIRALREELARERALLITEREIVHAMGVEIDQLVKHLLRCGDEEARRQISERVKPEDV